MAEGGRKDAVDLTISIANRNGLDYLRGCIASIRSGTRRVNYEIVVVDNASTDDSQRMLRAEFPEVVLLENEVPRGYGASHNQAFAASRGRYFLVLNNDMIVHDGTIDAMMERIARADGIGLLGCRLLNPDNTLQPSCARASTVVRMLVDDLVPERFTLERFGLRERMSSWAHDSERDVDVVQGSCMLLPREIFDRAGRFDEQFSFFREEFDLCRRVKDAGARVVFFPEVTIIHFGSQTLKTIPRDAYHTAFESRYKYFAKHEGRLAGLAVTCSAFMGVLARLLPWSVLWVARLKADNADARVRLYAQTVPWFFQSKRPWILGNRT